MGTTQISRELGSRYRWTRRPLTLPDGGRLWLVTRHDDVERALRDPRLSKRDPRIAHMPPAMRAIIGHQMLGQDPPDHTRLRRLVSQAFTPRLVGAMESRIQHIADALLDRVQLRGHLDLVDDYAHPLPLTVIAELLGIPEVDHEPFRHWSHAAVANDITGAAMPEWRTSAMVEFAAYIAALCDRKRREPGDDLVSGLVHAADDGDALSGDELLAMVWLLIVAGHETTVNLIGNEILALLRHPAQLRLLRADPALLPAAVEELLRYDGPVETSTPRFSTAEVALPGGTIPAGEPVLVVLASANRDGARSPNRTSSTCAGPTPGTSRSARASTTAWAPRWPGWKGGSRSARCCAGRRHCVRPSGSTRSSGARACSCAGSARSRC